VPAEAVPARTALLAIVLADGAVPSRPRLDAAWPDWDRGAGIVVAADGGARHATAFGLRVDRWVGDGDSIDAAELEALRASGTSIGRLPDAKDETDTEVAIEAAIAAGAERVVVLGALGGARIDHALANVGLLAHPALAGRRAWLFDEGCARLSLIDATTGPVSRRLEGRVGDLVSLLPLAETAAGVTTAALRYPLDAEPLVLGETRGVSNVRVATEATVTLQGGRLLVIETPVTVDS
jgi:thiamine pyrophosphokinase